MKLYKLLLPLGLLLTNNSLAEEISLFNSKGEAIAYIDTDDELTIYLWNGKPTSYLKGDDIYGFNGKHLGWWDNGLIRDHNGDAVGGLKEAIGIYTQYEPYKGYKEYKPYKKYTEYAPYQPYYSNSWSREPLSIFLAKGI